MAADSCKMFHIFDVDKTIVDTSTVKDSLILCIRSGIIPSTMLLYVPYFFILFTITGINEEQFKKPYRYLKGISERELNNTARQLYEDHFKSRIFPGIVELIKDIQAKGEEVIIASASFRFILKPLMEDFGIENMICSEIEFEEGVSTGRIKGLPAFQKAKLLRVHRYLEEKRINLSECSFYTDSHRDLSLLNTVGRPVAVNPDRRLRKTARKNGWEIIETKKAGRRKHG